MQSRTLTCSRRRRCSSPSFSSRPRRAPTAPSATSPTRRPCSRREVGTGQPPGLSCWNSTAACCSWAGARLPQHHHGAARHRPDRLRAQHLGAGPRRRRRPYRAAFRRPRLQPAPLRHPGVPGPARAPGPHLPPPRRQPPVGRGPIPPIAAVFEPLLEGNQLTGQLPAGHRRQRGLRLHRPRRQPVRGRRVGAAWRREAAERAAPVAARNRFELDLGRVEQPEAVDILEVDHNMVYGSVPATAAAREWLAFDVSYNRLCGPGPYRRGGTRTGSGPSTSPATGACASSFVGISSRQGPLL